MYETLLFILFIAVIVFALCCQPIKISGGAYQGPQLERRAKDPELDRFIEDNRDIETRNIARYIRQTDEYLPTIRDDIREYYSKKQ